MIHALAEVLVLFAEIVAALVVAYAVVAIVDRKWPGAIEWIDSHLFDAPEEDPTQAISR